MTGTKGRSGGKREGAGRKPAPTCKAITLKPGDVMMMGEKWDDGRWTMGDLVDVIEVSRTHIRLRTRGRDGSEPHDINILR